MTTVLKVLPRRTYRSIRSRDPLHLYYWPYLGRLYRRRVEMCLEECVGGQRVLEVGFGCGISFLNLHELYDEIHGIDLEAHIEDTHTRFQQQGIQTWLRRGNVLDLPYDSGSFDTVLLVSILEHLKADELSQAAREIFRVLRPGGQVVYGVPVERPLMVLAFRLLGYNIREHHFSTEHDVRRTFEAVFSLRRLRVLKIKPTFLGNLYEVGHFVRPSENRTCG
jgi:ubiquinone/menaquinone biosynthesis C-methylase UbiE